MNPDAGVAFGSGTAAYIVARGGVVTLRDSPRHGCCGGSASVPVAQLGAPDACEGFVVWQQDGVTAFIEQQLLIRLPLEVRLEGLFRWRRLFVEGAGLGKHA